MAKTTVAICWRTESIVFAAKFQYLFTLIIFTLEFLRPRLRDFVKLVICCPDNSLPPTYLVNQQFCHRSMSATYFMNISIYCYKLITKISYYFIVLLWAFRGINRFAFFTRVLWVFCWSDNRSDVYYKYLIGDWIPH